MLKKVRSKILCLLIVVNSITNLAYAKKRNKKMITVGIGKFQDSLDPREAYNFQHFILIQCLMDTLVNLDESGNVSSELAKKWNISENKLSYSFELKDKLKFQDGTRITSKDIAFSLSRHLWPSSNSLVGIYLEPIVGYTKKLKEGEILKGIKIESDSKISIHLKRITPSFLYVLTMPSFSVISQNAIEKKLGAIGSGRMKLSKSSNELFLEAWDQYIGSKPQLEKIKLIEYSKPEEIIQKLNADQVDIAIGMATDSVNNIKNKNVTKGTVKTLTYSHLFYNIMRNALLKNKDFRKELSALFQKVAKEISAKTPFLEYLPTYFPKGIMPTEYYNKKGNTFDEKSFSTKWKEQLEKEKLEVALVENVYPKSFIDALEAYITKHSIGIKVIKMSFGEYNQRLKSKEYDVISGIYMGNFPDPDGFIEPIIQGEEYSFGVMPIETELKKIHKINEISDKYKRLKEYAALFSKIENEHYFVPLFKDKIPLLYNKDLQITKSAYRYESELWKIFWRE